MPITIYVGMALTEAPEEFRNAFQESLKEGLRDIPGVEVLDFVGLEAGTARDVYRHDLKCTLSADLCVFIVEHPSTGLGMEIMARLQSGNPMLVCDRVGKRVTRMITGMLAEREATLYLYEQPSDVVDYVRARLQMLNLFPVS